MPLTPRPATDARSATDPRTATNPVREQRLLLAADCDQPVDRAFEMWSTA